MRLSIAFTEKAAFHRAMLACWMGIGLLLAGLQGARAQNFSVGVQVSGTGTWNYTLVNAEPVGSGDWIAAFSLPVSAPVVVTGVPTNWTYDTDGATFVTWYNTEPSPYPSDLAPQTFSNQFSILTAATSSSTVDAILSAFDHTSGLPGPSVVHSVLSPSSGPSPVPESSGLTGMVSGLVALSLLIMIGRARGATRISSKAGMALVCLMAVAALASGVQAQQSRTVDFEDGVDGGVVRSVPGITFTTTNGQPWLYIDWRTGHYNGKYPNGAYTSNGNFGVYLGASQSRGRIDFTLGQASYVSVGTSTQSGLVLEAYDKDGKLLQTSPHIPSNVGTGRLDRLSVNTPGISYVIVHDSGNYWLIDDLVTDAPGSSYGNKPLYASLHAHTGFSDGGIGNFDFFSGDFAPTTPLTAFAEAGRNHLDVLAITDHAELLSPLAQSTEALHGLGLGWIEPWFFSSHYHLYKDGTSTKFSMSDATDEWGDTGTLVDEQNRAQQAGSLGLIALRGFEWSADGEATARGHINVIGTSQPVGNHFIRSDKLTTSYKRTLDELYDWVDKLPENGEDGFVCQFNHPNLYSDTPFSNLDESALSSPSVKQHFALMEMSTHDATGYHGPRDIWFQLISPIIHYRTNEQLYVQALANGWHLAPTFNEDNHQNGFGADEQKTGIWVERSSPESVMDALLHRRVFATEDRNFRLMVYGNGQPMGSTLRLADLPVSPGGDRVLPLEVIAEDDDNRVNENIYQIDLLAGKVDAQGLPLPVKSLTLNDIGRYQNKVHKTIRFALSQTAIADAFPSRTTGRDLFFFVRVTQYHRANTTFAKAKLCYIYSSPIWINTSP